MRLDDARTVANNLMRTHANHQIAQGWAFGGFDRAHRRAGVCQYTKKMWTLSKSFTELNAESVIRQVCLHEIAHVLIGPGHGHDSAWSRAARGIGYTGDATLDNKKIITTQTPLWWGICEENSDHRVGYHRRPGEKTVRYGRCPRCRGKISWLNTRTGEMLVVDKWGHLVYAGNTSSSSRR